MQFKKKQLISSSNNFASQFTEHTPEVSFHGNENDELHCWRRWRSEKVLTLYIDRQTCADPVSPTTEPKDASLLLRLWNAHSPLVLFLVIGKYHVTPIDTNGTTSYVSNYRPISFISQMQDCLTENKPVIIIIRVSCGVLFFRFQSKNASRLIFWVMLCSL